MLAVPTQNSSHIAALQATNDNCHLHLVSDTYDPTGNLEKIRYFGGATTKYTYDQSGRMQDARFSFNGLTANENLVASYSYDVAGRLTNAWHGDRDKVHATSVNPDYPAHAESRYAYDADSDLNRLTTRWSRPDLDRTTLYGFSYRYAHDQAAKLVNAYSTGSDWRYVPVADKTETYSGTNALDQYGSVDLGDGAGALTQDTTKPIKVTRHHGT